METWRILTRRTYEALRRVDPVQMPDYLRTRGLDRWLAAGVERARRVRRPWQKLLFRLDADLGTHSYVIKDTWVINE